MMSHRKTIRHRWRPGLRRVHRPGFRQRWRSPDDLGIALAAFRRAIRAHRRLARLAPHHFDVAVVEHDRLAHQDRLRWMQIWEPALEKVYGPPTPAERQARRAAEWLAGQPPPLPPATQRAVAHHRAAWEFWLTAGRRARERHQQRRPHALPSLGRLARLLEVAIDFGRLATGADSSPPAFVPHNDEAVWADLRRAYGHLDPELSGCPRPEAETSPRTSTDLPDVGGPPPTTTAPGPPSVTLAPASAPPPPRADAYRRLARQLRLRAV